MANISKKIIKKTSKLLDYILPYFLLVVTLSLSMPHLALAGSVDIPTTPQLPYQAGKTEVLLAKDYSQPRLPVNAASRQPRIVSKVWLTAYNSHPAQTDDSPCITASGLNVCQRATEDIIATNYLHLPFGTKVKFPELFGDKIFIVEDRMNARYQANADIWMLSYEDAKQFGRKYTTIEIF